MKNLVLRKLTPLALATALVLSGCSKKSECEIPSRHIHRYTKQITGNIEIERYIDSESLTVSGYNWNQDYIEMTKEDEALYKLLNSKGLMEADENWDYLYYKMANNHDYLKFYYEYDTVETYTETDSEGNVEVHTRTVHHDGWHTNPNDSDNTGKTRLYHHRYYAYRVVYKNGKFVLEKSPEVDDIREVLADYPYVSESCVTEVYEQFKFNRRELKYLNPEDFDTFNHPDLSNTSMNINPVKQKELDN